MKLNRTNLPQVPQMMEKVKEKISKECDSGTTVISARFEVPGMKLLFTKPGGPIDGLWVYKKD